MKSLKKESQPMLDEPMQIMYPNFSADNEQMPEIDSWEVGKEYTITTKVRMSDYSTHVDEKANQTSHACFDMVEYKVEK